MKAVHFEMKPESLVKEMKTGNWNSTMSVNFLDPSVSSSQNMFDNKLSTFDRESQMGVCNFTNFTTS